MNTLHARWRQREKETRYQRFNKIDSFNKSYSEKTLRVIALDLGGNEQKVETVLMERPARCLHIIPGYDLKTPSIQDSVTFATGVFSDGSFLADSQL